jgi:hypothetical protein
MTDTPLAQDIRAAIDKAKQDASLMDKQASTIQIDTGTGEVVELKIPRGAGKPEAKKEAIDPSNVAIAANPHVATALIAQLIEVRA